MASTRSLNMHTTRPSISASSGGAVKSRQLLAQLSANLADTENLVRMTSVQAESMRGLGAWHGGIAEDIEAGRAADAREATQMGSMLMRNRFMAASKVLGEEAINRDAAAQAKGGQR
ncbi:hypothetical protein GCG54_00009264 [Colletotrichum gloeosporioides]|uniref:Uncharacterized protein n=1 Tax=Colletotrichum gloeosporioides TaxID=474922 RepID=A0A8H4C3Y1_COLGL|nr:uncharacterized protein GCG54_00009264 [Colletotrichum gloeosporioides]KAF3797293.1 hypothetical protein GCG54_00009264 [Colletotrichum gloeosporioides]